MSNFDYPIIDGNSVERRVRARDLGTTGNGTQILGHQFWNDALGAAEDAAAADEAGPATVVALLKGALRELIDIASNPGGGGGSSGPAYLEGETVSSVTVNPAETPVVTIDCRGYSRLGLMLENTGASPLASFNTDIRMNGNAGGHSREANYAGAYDADSSALNGNATLLVRKSGGANGASATNPFTLAAGNRTWVRFNVEAIESVQFVATVAGGTTTTLDAWWILES
ncbi:MAG: hypothetical protein AAGF93_00130 [Cyanobacteria bacterium P01_H01_bin.105]